MSKGRVRHDRGGAGHAVDMIPEKSNDETLDMILEILRHDPVDAFRSGMCEYTTPVFSRIMSNAAPGSCLTLLLALARSRTLALLVGKGGGSAACI